MGGSPEGFERRKVREKLKILLAQTQSHEHDKQEKSGRRKTEHEDVQAQLEGRGDAEPDASNEEFLRVQNVSFER